MHARLRTTSYINLLLLAVPLTLEKQCDITDLGGGGGGCGLG